MTASNILNYGRHLLDEDDIASVVSVLRGDLITQGPVVEEFEKAIAAYTGAKHAVAVNSATAGLHLATKVAGLKMGDKHLTSPLTFVASANAALYNQAEVIFADIDPVTLGVSPASIAEKLHDAPDVKTIMPVHFAGLPANMEQIRAVAGNRLIIEDAAHALGAQYDCGEPVGCGKYSDMCVFSFHPVKPITTGEGGVITTNNSEWAERMKSLRGHGITKDLSKMLAPETEQGPWYYEQVDLGYNYRMPDILAALGLSQLQKIDSYIERRRAIASQYDQAFSQLEYLAPCQLKNQYRRISGLHLYTVRLDLERLKMTRTDVMTFLTKQNVGTQVHYIPVYRQPFHQNNCSYDYAKQFPNTESHYQSCLSLPIYPAMTDENIDTVINAVFKLAGAERSA